MVGKVSVSTFNFFKTRQLRRVLLWLTTNAHGVKYRYVRLHETQPTSKESRFGEKK
jgi:hypothetical protein